MERDIMQTVHCNAYHKDPYAKEFGIKISAKLASVESRILPARFKYHDTGKENDCLPQIEQWNMMNKEIVNQRTAFNHEPVLPPHSARPEHVEKVLKTRYNDAMTKLGQGKELDLIIFILPDNNGSLYGDLNRICETDLSLVSQCCLTKHVFRMSEAYTSSQ